MRTLTGICILALMVPACAYHHQMGRMNDIEKTEFGNRAANDAFLVNTSDGSSYRGRTLLVEADSILWHDTERGALVGLPLDSVESIAFSSRLGGVGNGFGEGFLIGAGTGVLLGLMGGSDECNGGGQEIDFCISRGGAAVLLGIGLGIACGLVGGAAGGATGATHYYYPRETATSHHSPGETRYPPGPIRAPKH